MKERIVELIKQLGGIQCDEDGDELTPILVGEDLATFYNLAVSAEQKRCIGIIYGQCGSDNVAQRTVDAIRKQND